MGKRTVLLVVVIAIAAGVATWWYRGRDRAPAATAPATGSATAAPRTAHPAKPEPASLAISVGDALGPVANAIVRLAPADGEVVTVKAGTDGVARAAPIAPGEWQISASAPGHEPAALTKRISAGEDVRVAMVLPTGGRTLSGTVTDASGGPITGARIDAAQLHAARPDRAIATALTGTDGTYRMTVPEGQVVVAARSADYAAQSRYVEVGPEGATADFALVPGGVIEGVVLDAASHQPVAGAAVEAAQARGAVVLAEAGGHHVVAGGDGKFRITGLRPGSYELDASAENRRTKEPTIVGLGVAEQVAEVELLVGTSPVIRGRVVDGMNAPVASATVRALARTGQGEAKSDANGAFVLEGLAPGDYTLVAQSDEMIPAGDTPVTLKSQDLDGVVVRMRRGGKIRGHVEPRQIADVQLEAGEDQLGAMMVRSVAPVTTQADGAFELGPTTPGKATISARCPSGDQGELAIAITEQMGEVVLKVSPGGSIAGRVVDGEHKPVGGATVMAQVTGGTETTTIVNGMVTSGAQAMTGTDGSYELKGLHPGTYRMAALDRGRPLRLRGKPPQVALAAVEHKTGVEIAVDRPTGVIKGAITGADGKPLADAWVSVHQDMASMIEGVTGGREPPGEGGQSRMVRVEAQSDGEGGAASDFPPALTDAQGRYEIRNLPHGAYEVVAEAQAGKLRARRGDVKPDATVDLQLVGLTTLSGTVRGARGPAALFTVELDGPTRAQRTFTDGAFEMGRVDPGTYTVRVTSSDGSAEQQVEVVAGKPATVDLTLAANAIVVGSVVDKNGKPVANIPVVVVDDTGGNSVSVQLEGPPPTTGLDGKFRIERKAGKGTLVLMVPPRPVTKRGLTLVAGQTLDVGAVPIDGAPAPP